MYNGNIRNIALEISGLEAIGYTYRYDQLHRLLAMNPYNKNQLNSSSYAWNTTGSVLASYRTTVKYDGNGNIRTLSRFGNNFQNMDNLFYHYNTGTNQLNWIDDLQTNDNLFADDLDRQALNNYRYDGSGNLLQDSRNGVKDIRWLVSGKVEQVERTGDKFIQFGYDAMQQRVAKVNLDDNNLMDATYYIRDAQGNPLAVYEMAADSTLTWSEQYLYGSSRLGVFRPEVKLDADTVPVFLDSLRQYEGSKFFELSNHLGNVLATVSDRRQPKFSVGGVDYYNPVVVSAQDYYPFGMEMPGRSYALGALYRFGFNGKEADRNKEFGSLVHYDYGFRIYCAPCGRFLSVDPLRRSYSELTPYQFASNTPIQAIDLDGLEAFIIHGTNQTGTGLKLDKKTKDEIMRIGGNTYADDNFTWNAPIYNTRVTRRRAAGELNQYIARTRHRLIKEGKITKDEPITLVGYSHGGNVGIQATGSFGKIGDKVNLITIATPAYNTTWQDAYGGGFNSEDPRNSKGINHHIHIYHENDAVDAIALGNETYIALYPIDQYEITDKEINLSSLPIYGGIESHMELPTHPDFGKYLESIPTMKKAPAPKNLDKIIENDPKLD